jgi:hypothetical protein
MVLIRMKWMLLTASLIRLRKIIVRKRKTKTSEENLRNCVTSIWDHKTVTIWLFRNAHSTRAAATSAAQKCGVPLADILRNAGWTNAQTFQKFYKRNIVLGKKGFSPKMPSDVTAWAWLFMFICFHRVWIDFLKVTFTMFLLFIYFFFKYEHIL